MKEFLSELENCKYPEDVFGVPHSSKPEKEIQHTYRTLVKAYPIQPGIQTKEEVKICNDILLLLNKFYEEAKQKLELGTYGDKTSTAEEEVFILKTRKNEYSVSQHILQDDYSDFYLAECNGKKVCIKIITEANDNDLIENEYKIMKKLKYNSLQNIEEKFRSDDHRLGLVFSYVEGITFEELHSRYSKGVPAIHIAWIMDRLFSVIGYIHSKGIVHGNLHPSNIIVTPSDHNVIITDFTFSIKDYHKKMKKYKVVNEFSAPEIEKKFKVHPASDMYSLGKCMLYISGGKEKPFWFPKDLHWKISDLIEGMMNYSPDSRSSDAWKLWHELQNVRNEVFGKHKFIKTDLKGD